MPGIFHHNMQYQCGPMPPLVDHAVSTKPIHCTSYRYAMSGCYSTGYVKIATVLWRSRRRTMLNFVAHLPVIVSLAAQSISLPTPSGSATHSHPRAPSFSWNLKPLALRIRNAFSGPICSIRPGVKFYWHLGTWAPWCASMKTTVLDVASVGPGLSGLAQFHKLLLWVAVCSMLAACLQHAEDPERLYFSAVRDLERTPGKS